MHVVVVGAGLGGLSAACYLRGAGHHVTVVERESVPGGRAGLLEESGFKMDTGPTVMTMTGLLDDAFKAVGANMSEHVLFKPLDPMYRAVYPDGSEILCRRGLEAMRAEIGDKCSQEDAIGFENFCKWLRNLYEIEMPHFIDRNFDSPLDLARPVSAMSRLVYSGGMRKLASVVGDYFKDERLQRLFSFQAMYAGLSPFQALAIYGVITYMDSVEGVYFPEGGMHSVAKAMADAVTAAGASIRYEATVERVVVESGKAKGVKLADGEFIAADAVVLNPDLPVAYRDLLPDLEAPKVTTKGSYSPSCLVWLAGVKGELPAGAAHHNIHFADQWREAFDALLKLGRPMPDPSILVTIPSSTDPTLAPPGSHSLYVLEPMPNLDGSVDWERALPERSERLVEHVSSLGYPVDDLQVSHFIDPLAWQKMGMERGTPFALSHKLFQTGPFRPSNRDSRVGGLFFVGSGTTPGVGIPMVLISGKLVTERVGQWTP